MTPFALLETEMRKRAGTQPFPFAQQYQPGRVPAPMPAPGTAPVTPGLIKHPGVIDNMWGDIAVSSIPIVGSAYMANKAIGDFRNGNIGSGLGNLLWAGVGLIPGVGAIKGGLGALKGVAKGVGAAATAKAALGGAARGSLTTGPIGAKGMLGLTGAGIAAPMLLDPARPAQQPAPQASPVVQPQAPTSFIESSINSIRNAQGMPPQ